MKWKKEFVNKLVNSCLCSYNHAMTIMDIVCDLRINAYTKGYNSQTKTDLPKDFIELSIQKGH